MNLIKWIDLADITDVIIVAMLMYAGLVWFKKTRAFLVVVGIVILGVVYAAARYLDLFLTTAILQGFFAVLLIAVIVIFQEELRHFFEHVALWGLGRHQIKMPTPLVSTLVRTASDLARAKVGALIVIVGQDPIERHIEGGTELDGQPSEELLKSIFDRSSPGHDGAVIIEGGRVLRFAAYLPLSKDINKLEGIGTRHAAALGLVERCDALCIVVSEERGVVSVARDGEMAQVKDAESLGKIIDDYLKEKFPPKEVKRVTNIVRKNFREKMIAILMAIGLWVVFAYGVGIVHREFSVPVEYSNIPEGYSVEHAIPRELMLTLSGDERAFRLLNRDSLKVSLDLRNAKDGRQKIMVDEEDVTGLPRNFSIDNVRPSEIEVLVKRSDNLKLR